VAGWEKVLRKLQNTEMPPPGLPRPGPDATRSFIQWLGNSFDQASAAEGLVLSQPSVQRILREAGISWPQKRTPQKIPFAREQEGMLLQVGIAS
jgi:hypothetical protein